MGLTHVEVDLIQCGDVELARRGHIDKDEIRHIPVLALVDSGCYFMAINENIQEILQLPVLGIKRSVLAKGQRGDYPIVGPLQVRYKEHIANCSAIVLPDDSEPLLGALPMEEMHVILDPQRQELIEDPYPIRI